MSADVGDVGVNSAKSGAMPTNVGGDVGVNSVVRDIHPLGEVGHFRADFVQIWTESTSFGVSRPILGVLGYFRIDLGQFRADVADS